MKTTFAKVLVLSLCLIGLGRAGQAGALVAPRKPAGAKLWVPLTVAERAGAARTAEPVTGGVPLPEGLITDPARLALVGPGGKPVPAQFTVATRWWPGKSIKWVLVDFQATVPAKGRLVYYLTDAARNPAPANPVKVQVAGDVATVTTGKLKLVVRRNAFNLFDEAWIDETGKGKYDETTRIVKTHKAGPWLFHGGATLPTYKRFSPMNDPDVKMTLEEAGPLRAVLKLSGKHLAAPGDKVPGGNHLLDFVCRIHFYANSGLVKVVYTMSCRQGKSISDGVPLDRAWLSLPLTLDKQTRTWAVGLPGGKSIHPGSDVEEVMPPWRKGVTPPGAAVKKYHQAGLADCWIFAKDSDHIEYHGDFFRKRNRFIVKGKSDKQAALTAGWLDLADADKGVAVGIKWFWQTYPRAVKADPSAVMVLLHANFESRPPLMTSSHGPRANWYPGMSQTSTSMFYFHGKRDLARIVGAYAGINRPLRPVAPPSWYCEGTQAFGRLASSTKSLYDEAAWKIVQGYDARLRASLDRILKFRDYDFGDFDQYGMFNFGDCINYIKSQRADPGDKHVSWDNGYYDYPHAFFLQFARTGDPDFLETGIEAQHHVADLDMMGWHPNKKMIGANRYCDGTMHIRWAQGGIYASGTFNHYKTQSHFERFYLTGERRARDMGLISAEFAMQNNGMGWGEPRSLGHGPLGVLAAWEATGHPRYLKRMKFFEHQIADRALAANKPARIAKGRHWQGGIALEGMREFYEHTGDEKVYKALQVLVADCQSKGDYAASTLHAFAFLGAQLENENYTRKARGWIQKVGKVGGAWGYAASFGNTLRNTPYVFWYLSKDLPKKLTPKKLDADALPAPAGKGEAAAPKMNPQARLKLAKSTTLWKSEGKKLGARMARFSRDGSKLAWAVNGTDAGGGLLVADVAAGKVKTLWPAPAGASVEFLVWGPKGGLAACVRVVEGDKVKRYVVLSRGAAAAKELSATDGAYRVAWRADGQALAFSTKAGLFLYELSEPKAIKLLEAPEKLRPKKGPAFEDLVFYKNAVAARQVGTMRYTLVFPDKKKVDLGECRGLFPDPKRNRLYLVPWRAGPVKIPRGAGVAWVNPEAEKIERKVIVADRPAAGGGKPYWLVDVWDWHYPSTLRVSDDGKTLTFVGVKAGVLAKNPWREFCIWRVPSDGSKAPTAAVEAGVIFKRLDVGAAYCIGWRYAIENACVFLDLAGGRAWRLPKGFYVQRANSDALPGKLLIAGARGKDVILFQLAEDKDE